MGRRLTWMAWGMAATVVVTGTAAAQGFFARGDTTCSVTLSASDVVAQVRALGGTSACGNDDCDRDGSVTSADATCTAGCLFGECTIPATAPHVSTINADSAPTIVPLSAITITGTNFGASDRLKRVTIGGVDAEVVDFVAPDMLQVIVPMDLPPGPADVVVFDGDLPGPSSQITITQPTSIGPPDTVDGTLGLADTAAALLGVLDLESSFGANAPFLRQALQTFRTDLAAQRAALAADPNLTTELRAQLDAAFDSSGAPEMLRQLISDIEALLVPSARIAIEPAAAPLGVFARGSNTIKIVAGVARGAGVALSTPALILLGAGAAIIGGVLVAANDPLTPLIYNLTFFDADGIPRPYATAGGLVRAYGARFDSLSTSLVAQVAGGEVIASPEGSGADYVDFRLPDGVGLCGKVTFLLSRTMANIRSNPVPSRIQPELLGIEPASVTSNRIMSIRSRGASCPGATVFFTESFPGLDAVAARTDVTDPLTFVTAQQNQAELAYHDARSGTITVPYLTTATYRVNVGIQQVRSSEPVLAQVESAPGGLVVSCSNTQLGVPDSQTSTLLTPSSGNLTYVPLTSSTCTAIMFARMPQPSAFAWSSSKASVAFVAPNSSGPMTTVTSKKIGTADIGAVLQTADDKRFITDGNAVTITVSDVSAPTISLSSDPPPGMVDPGSSIQVMVNAKDNSGLTDISFMTTGDAVANTPGTEICFGDKTCTPTVTLSVKDKDYTSKTVTIQATARDVGTNTTQSNVLTFQIKGDTTCPSVIIQSPADGGTVNAGSTVQVTATATDNEAGDTGVKHFIYSATGDALVAAVSQDLPFPMPLPAPTLNFVFSVKKASDLISVTDKTITVSVEAVDDAGNTCGPDVITLTAIGTLDQCDGGISVDDPADCDGKAFTITVAISGAAADKVTRVTSINPGGQFDLVSQGGGTYTVTLFYQGEGSFTLTFYAYDADNNALCSGSIGLAALGPCLVTGPHASQAERRLPAGVVAGATRSAH